MFLRLMQLVLHLFREPGHVADDTETNIVLHEDLILKTRKDKSHESMNLGLWPVPVLRREGIERKVFDAQTRTL